MKNDIEPSASSSAEDFANQKLALLNRLTNFSYKFGYEIQFTQFYRRMVKLCNDAEIELEYREEVFLTDLNPTILEDEIFSLFSKVGPIHELRLMVEPSGLLNRGLAYIRYFNSNHTQQAVKLLNGYPIRPDVKIQVTSTLENCRLYIAGIDETKTKEEIHEELSKNVDGIVNVIFMKKHQDETKINRGFVFVDFLNYQLAIVAKEILENNFILFEKFIIVRWAIPLLKDTDPTMLRSSKIVLRHLSNWIKKSQVIQILKCVINYQYVKNVFHCHDYCFVQFSERKHAEHAMANLKEFFELHEISSVEISWALPSKRQNKRKRPTATNFAGSLME